MTKKLMLLAALVALSGCTTVSVVYTNRDPDANLVADRKQCSRARSYTRCMRSLGWSTEAWELP